MSWWFAALQDDRERDALRVDDEVVFAAELAPVRGIRAGFWTDQPSVDIFEPKFMATEEVSMSGKRYTDEFKTAKNRVREHLITKRNEMLYHRIARAFLAAS